MITDILIEHHIKALGDDQAKKWLENFRKLIENTEIYDHGWNEILTLAAHVNWVYL